MRNIPASGGYFMKKFAFNGWIAGQARSDGGAELIPLPPPAKPSVRLTGLARQTQI
jgi:hypothetical protein